MVEKWMRFVLVDKKIQWNNEQPPFCVYEVKEAFKTFKNIKKFVFHYT